MSDFMNRALQEAQAAADAGEVPVGAVVVLNGDVIATGNNRVLRDCDPTAHAEVVALRAAAQILGSDRLPQCDLYVTLEPCTLCATAISFARIRRLYFAADDIKGGAVENGVRFYEQPTCHHRPEVYSGISEKEASRILKNFFKSKR